MTSEQIKKDADAIRLMVTANLIAEYAMLEFKDKTKQELRQKVNLAVKACRGVQNWFLTNDRCDEKTREQFKDNFLSDEIILIAEIMKLCFGLSVEDLETIISAIKNNTEVTNG